MSALLSRVALLQIAMALPVGAMGLVPALPAEDPSVLLEHAISLGEKSLRDGAAEAAEGHYREAIFEGWLLLGSLDRIEGRLAAAQAAFDYAATAVAANGRAVRAKALVDLQMGEIDEAESLLRRLVDADPTDVGARQLLAHALAAAGRQEEAVKLLEEARAAAPGDLELAFGLARAYLAVPRAEAAARVFDVIALARPIPQTHILIGRTYREFGEFERARSELQSALTLDPRARRAHYELGLTAVKEAGRARLEEAIAEFRAELRLEPEDPQANLELGIALVETQKPDEALAPLEIADRSRAPEPRMLAYLGRAQLGSGRPADAAASLRRALELAQQQGANAPALRAIHLPLGQALRALGSSEEAATHFAESQRLSAEGAKAEREQLTRYLDDAVQPGDHRTGLIPLIEASPLSEFSAGEREQLRGRVRTSLCRAHLNLGVLQAQGGRFEPAAELLAKAAELDPEFPQVQSSLGIAYFNAHQYDKATIPLTRALAQSPGDAALKRMLAMAWLETRSYAKAAELLQDDPERETNPSLQFAYGLALVRSERPAEAQAVFSRLLSRHGDSPELSVLLGQAYAQQGDFDKASAALYRALKLKPDVADAYATLGVIYLKQGRLAEAETALKAALAQDPKDLLSQQNLALVLDQEGRPQEALPLLRVLVERQPDTADARYLLGKILLAQGNTAEAIAQLESALRLAPEDANVHYQLAQAYQRSGNPELAQQHFDTFRKLKDRSREAAP